MNTRRRLLFALAAGLAAPAPLLAHIGTHDRSGDAAWWTHWNADPLILTNLAVLAALYAIGWRRMRAQRAVEAPVQRRQAVAFGAGLVGLFAALISPIDVLAVELLSVHMVQHMILMNLAAPLLVLGAPVRVMLWALPPAHRANVGRWKQRLERRGVPRYLFWQPVFLWTLYALVLWVWHLPSLYEAALQSNVVHDLQHIVFFTASCLFWRVMFDPIGRLRLSRGAAVIYLFTTSLHATLLGVFMALAPRIWYPTYSDRTAAWGLTALEDQQLAGYIMWMPACMMYALVAAVIFAFWLHDRSEEPVLAEPSQS